MASFYYYDQNPSGYCFLVQIKAFVNKTSLGLPNLNTKRKTKWILVLVVKRRHRANGPFHRPSSTPEAQKECSCQSGRIKVERRNERVRAKRCDAVDWDYAYKCRLFSTSVRACDVVCPLDTADVTELWRLGLFSCTSSSFLCAGTMSPRGKWCYFCGRFNWSRQTSLWKGSSYYFHDSTTEFYIFVLLLANVDVIPKQKQLSTV